MKFDRVRVYDEYIVNVLRHFDLSKNSNFKPCNNKKIVVPGDLMFVTEGTLEKIDIQVIDNVAHIEYVCGDEIFEDTIVAFLFQDEEGGIYFLMKNSIYAIPCF